MIECIIELNWLCKHTKNVRSSQPAIFAINWKKQFFPVSIVNHSEHPRQPLSFCGIISCHCLIEPPASWPSRKCCIFFFFKSQLHFPISLCPSLEKLETANLVTFTEEILDGKLLLLCSDQIFVGVEKSVVWSFLFKKKITWVILEWPWGNMHQSRVVVWTVRLLNSKCLNPSLYVLFFFLEHFFFFLILFTVEMPIL